MVVWTAPNTSTTLFRMSSFVATNATMAPMMAPMMVIGPPSAVVTTAMRPGTLPIMAIAAPAVLTKPAIAPTTLLMMVKPAMPAATPAITGSAGCMNCTKSPNASATALTAGWMAVNASAMPLMASVTRPSWLSESYTPCMVLVTLASSWPMAPSNVVVEVAASLATSVMPRFCSAWLNSSAVTSPADRASLNVPMESSHAPISLSSFWIAPDAPGRALTIWFQSCAMSLPAPFTCVMALAKYPKLSELPPAAALRLPAACTSLS